MDRNSPQSDKPRATGGAAPQERQPSRRKVRAAELYVTGQAKHASEAITRAGFSPATAINPTANALGPLDLMRAYHQAHGEELDAKTAHTTGMRTLLELARDRGEPGSTRGAAAKTLVEIAKDEGVEAEGVTRVDWLAAYLKEGRRLARALALALRRPDLAATYLDRLEERIAAWRREYEALAPSVEVRRNWVGRG